MGRITDMAHYDLYQTLGLDRGLDTGTLAAELDRRLATGVATNPGGIEELAIARKILGDPQRRDMYDRRLDDATAPTIDITALRDLADSDLAQTDPGQSGQPGQAAQYGQTSDAFGSSGTGGSSGSSGGANVRSNTNRQGGSGSAWQKVRSEVAASSTPVIVGTAVLTLLSVLLVWGIVAAISEVSSYERKVRAAANEFLQLEGEVETREWISQNGYRKAKADIREELDLDGDYDGVADYFGTSAPQVGNAVDAEEYFDKLYGEGAVQSYVDDESVEKVFDVGVQSKTGMPTGGGLTFYIVDGEPKLNDVFSSESLRNLVFEMFL